MQDSQIEEIKNKLNVIDIVGSYIKLTKTGANYRGVCPFHSEKKPSFFVSPARQMWHCFGCGAGHSIFDFVMKIEGVEFGDALRILANKAGVELKRENTQLKTERARLYEVCELSCKFFEKQLEASAVGKEAEDYLLKRGITKDSIKKWRLGYSPDTWQGLSEFLISKGYNRNEVVRAGLAVVPTRDLSGSRIHDGEAIGKKENDSYHSYDRFRGRIIFPVFDLNSQVVGFGARVFKIANEKETAKYLNTPQTLLYDKSNILYGLNNAKLAIRKQNQCVITEGYTDAIMCHQAGFENTVAASGTALTSQHLNILKRYSENLILAFDMDIAGDSATKRGINLAQEQGFNIKIIEKYSGSKDPADIILENPQNWQKVLESCRTIMDYYFDSAFSAFNKNTPEGKKEIGRIVLPAIKRLPNKIEQSFWIQKLSQKLDIKEEAIIEELNKVKITPGYAGKNAVSVPEKDKTLSPDCRKTLIEEKIVCLVLKDPDYVKIIKDDQLDFFSEKNKKFLQDLKSGNMPADDEFLAALALKGDSEYEKDGEDEVCLCLLQLKNIELKNKLNKISGDIKKAEQENDPQKVSSLVEEFNNLSKEL